ncbi:MAG: tetratricopeptide repeat protein [Rhodanobacteraceae bacterium]|nr:tetratricopeptide repeat protein [Rhodanobacteraceae bacterium]
MRNLILLLAVLLGGCAGAPAPETPAQPVATNLFALRYPLTPEQRATTSAGIYLGNLNARIEVLDAQLQRAGDASVRGNLAGALLLRFRILGRLTDGERALELAAAAAAAAPEIPELHLVNAAALSAFHRFSVAEQALMQAQTAGAAEQNLKSVRRDLWMAQGHYDRLREDFEHSDEPVADFYELAHRADLRLMQGDLDGASRWYRTAQDFYQDVDPLPLAWLYSQQGIALLRHGHYAQARTFFAAAHQRLPEYYLATEHLAECDTQLGQLDQARQLYQAVIRQTQNPEFMAALADLEDRAGNSAAAATARQNARAGYDALLARHRAAYAQHAAEFLLDIGEHDEALALARENLKLRQDIGSLILLARSAEAAGAHDEACAAATRAQATGLKPPELEEIAPLSLSCSAPAHS